MVHYFAHHPDTLDAILDSILYGKPSGRNPPTSPLGDATGIQFELHSATDLLLQAGATQLLAEQHIAPLLATFGVTIRYDQVVGYPWRWPMVDYTDLLGVICLLSHIGCPLNCDTPIIDARFQLLLEPPGKAQDQFQREIMNYDPTASRRIRVTAPRYGGPKGLRCYRYTDAGYHVALFADEHQTHLLSFTPGYPDADALLLLAAEGALPIAESA